MPAVLLPVNFSDSRFTQAVDYTHHVSSRQSTAMPFVKGGLSYLNKSGLRHEINDKFWEPVEDLHFARVENAAPSTT